MNVLRFQSVFSVRRPSRNPIARAAARVLLVTMQLALVPPELFAAPRGVDPASVARLAAPPPLANDPSARPHPAPSFPLSEATLRERPSSPQWPLWVAAKLALHSLKALFAPQQGGGSGAPVTREHTFPPGWTLAAVPLSPTNPSVAAVFDELPVPRRVYDVVGGRTVGVDEPGFRNVAPGRAHWVLLGAARTISATGTLVSTSGPRSIPLAAGWNTIATPWLTSVPWSDARVSVRQGTDTRLLSAAVAAGWIEPDLHVLRGGVDSVLVPNASPAGQMTAWQGYLLFSTVQGELVLSPPPPDTVPPVLSLSGLPDGALISQPTDIVGTIDDPNLVAWSVQIGEGSTGSFVTVATGSGPVDGVLTVIDPTLMENGPQVLRVTAVDAAGNQSSVERTIVVTGTSKIGLFRLAFRDLDVPVAGVPITVTRVYDSRTRLSRRDFGFGWSLEVEGQGRYRNNRKPGDGWRFNSGPLGLPCLGSVVPTKAHYTEIRFSDQDVYEFALQIDRGGPILGGCTGTARFVQTGGLPGARLDILGGVDVFAPSGGDTVVELDTFEVYEPPAVRLTTSFGRSYDLGLRDGLRAIADQNGNAVSITPTGIVHSSGQSIQIVRDGLGRVNRIIDPAGNPIVYTYDAAGDLVTVTDREEHDVTITYGPEVPHLLAEIKDPLGRTPVRNEYDETGRLISTTDALGRAMTFEHDLSGQREVITDREGAVRVLEYDELGNIVKETDRAGKVVARVFDARNNLTSETDAHDPGDPNPPTSSFGYDGLDNILTARDPEGHVTTFTYNSRNQELTVRDARGTYTINTFDSLGNLLTQKVAATLDGPALSSTSFTRWPNGAIRSKAEVVDGISCTTQYEYDTAGNLTRETDPFGNHTQYTYDASGNRLTQKVSRTIGGTLEELVTEYEYDRQNRLTKTIDPDGTFTRTVYDALGRAVESFDKLGRRTQQVYDEMGRPTRAVYEDGTNEELTYDAEGRRLTARDREGRLARFEYSPRGELTKTTLPDGSFTVNGLDAAGRVVSVTDARGHTVTHGYDLSGRRTSTRVPLAPSVFAETVFTYDENGNVLTVRDPNGETTRSEYDERGRPTKRIFPDGTFTETTYDALGRKRFARDQAGRITELRYDCAGQLVKVVDASGKETSYGHDEGGFRTSIADANGRISRFEYDRLGRQTKRLLPDGAFDTQTYDEAGNLKTRTDFAGRTTTYTYDTNDRLLARTYSDGTPDVEFTYTASGLRKTAEDARGITNYDYDLRGRLKTLTHPDGKKLDYAYDGNGNRTSLTARIGALTLATAYTYDPANRLDLVTDILGRVYDHGYDRNGNRTSLAQPNGALTSYGYDRLNRLTSLGTQHVPTAQVIQSYALTLGAAGNRTRVAENAGVVREYGYDALYRVTSERVTLGGALDYDKAFTYDFVGNRLTETTNGRGAGSQTYAYDTRDRLLNDGLAAYTNDDNGNVLTRAGDATYAWDVENRLVKVTKSNGTVTEIAYDADGNRVRSKVTPATGPPQETHFLVDPSGPLAHVVAETDAAGVLRAHYVRGDDLLAAMRPDAAGPGGWSTRYYHADSLGSVRSLSDEAGSVTDTYEYTAFGELLTHTGSDPQPYAFAGEALDLNVGFQYHRARWMDPQVGRFVGMDPLLGSPYDPVSLHRYLYANADPVGHVDPTGQFSLGSMACSFAISGVINAMATAVFSLVSGQPISGWDLWNAFWIGGLTAPIGGFLVRAFAPLIRASLQPLLAAIGSMPRITLVGKAGFSAWLVRVSRWFVNTNKHYPPVGSTLLGKIMKRAFPKVDWEMHHVFIQQAWSRAGSQYQLYDDVLANEGLRRVGNGIWNLMPIPASLNNWLGKHLFATQMIATAYYSVMVFGGWHTVAAFSE